MEDIQPGDWWRWLARLGSSIEEMLDIKIANKQYLSTFSLIVIHATYIIVSYLASLPIGLTTLNISTILSISHLNNSFTLSMGNFATG